MRGLVSLALGSVLVVVACDEDRRRAPPAAPATAASAVASAPAAPATEASAPDAKLVAAETLTWHYASTPAGPIDVVVAVPAHTSGEKLPVVIALHGRGEAFKGPARGARGWLDDYGLLAAERRLRAPPLTRAGLEGMADDARLARMNESLSRRPFRGVIVVCPYTPDVLADGRPFSAVAPFTEFVKETLLPRVRRDAPALAEPAATGIDGVSLGGRVALLTGLALPELFGVVASEQAAFDSADAPELARLAVEARRRRPSLKLRLLTSDRDYFLRPNRAISRALTDAGVPHEFVEIPGTHSYEFNRGPGAVELLLFHDRALRGEPPL
ncbi:MAG: alpha/beta hydrolase-fold protein [Sorangiineae bacterium]|nr:alpha/beta hydrolase-fold protein [Polyangiaceae bacterium]MEB2323222.1 alpha/beta hydrolase-fold protein [Sorangiineae bacterium]